jgi:hypothetical protein
MIKQVSIFIENRAGRLYEISKLLGDNNINIRALSLADTSDFGILRLIVDKPDEATALLKKNNFAVSETNVVAIEVSDTPGGLANILKIFNDNKINVEYMYAFVEEGNKAVIAFRFDDDKAKDKLKKAGVKLMKAEEIYNL